MSCFSGCVSGLTRGFFTKKDKDVFDIPVFAAISEDTVRRTKSGRRPSMVMKLHQLTSAETGFEVTKHNIRPGMYVTRGPDWNWGNEDGDEQKPGMVVNVDERSETATVFWAAGGVYSHYRIGENGKSDLCEVLADDATASQSSESSSYNNTVRRNSQPLFADKRQTIIVLDWDDTLFPSSFIRQELGLTPKLPLNKQRISAKVRNYAEACLKESAIRIQAFLKVANRYGKLVIVTLARRPWVQDACAYFYPGVWQLLVSLQVQIVYAQEGAKAITNKRPQDMTEQESAAYYSYMKGNAISQALKEFYSLYEGQSWKNVISIGDSNFERHGTQQATRRYLVEQGGDASSLLASKSQEVDGHVYKVRTKTLKMLDMPAVDELLIQVQMVQKWLPLLAVLDDSFDGDLNDIHDAQAIAAIESKLRGECIVSL